jgi:hypothetical protein
VDRAQLSFDEYRVNHRHKDGSWGEMVEHHDSASHDPERKWSMGRLFKCTSCDEWAVVQRSRQDGTPELE